MKRPLTLLATAYCAGVVKNRPFIDGNKRTGILSAVDFLGLNGLEANFDEAMVVTLVYGLAASQVVEDKLADWLRTSAVNH